MKRDSDRPALSVGDLESSTGRAGYKAARQDKETRESLLDLEDALKSGVMGLVTFTERVFLLGAEHEHMRTTNTRTASYAMTVEHKKSEGLGRIKNVWCGTGVHARGIPAGSIQITQDLYETLGEIFRDWVEK